MNVKGGGVAVVCVILNFGLLTAKGSHDAPEDWTSVEATAKPTATSKSATTNTTNQSSKSILTHHSSTNKVIESTSSTPPKSTLPAAPNSTLSTKPKSTSPTTSKPSLSRATAPHTIMTSVLSSTLPTPQSTHSSNFSSKSQMSSASITVSSIWNTSSTHNNVTDSSANISTTHFPKIEDDSGLHISPGTALGIFVIVLIIVTVGSIIFYKMKKRGNLSCQQCKICLPRRRRRSSTSSRGPLTQDDATFVNITDHPRPERELFSIGDQDGGHDGRPGSLHRRGTEDDYFYDEIFGKSAFVDETTNRANTHLTVDDDDDDDELGRLNIPDLVFKKPK